MPQRLPSQTESVASNRTGQSGVSAAAGTGQCEEPSESGFPPETAGSWAYFTAWLLPPGTEAWGYYTPASRY